ncbi:hypothetical protein INR49_000874 [Caranx melampygus]|nr:hypothetical protein INR49_000874 [Caranx melampygus]
MKTETCCWARGAMTDLAILVTPTACELLEALPLETTLSGSQMELSTWRDLKRPCYLYRLAIQVNIMLMGGRRRLRPRRKMLRCKV